MTVVQAVGWYFPEALGGTEIYVAGLAERLRERGCEVRIVAPQAGGSGPRTYSHDGVEVFRYPIPTDPTRAECQGSAPVRGSEILHRWLADVRPDVFHCHTFVTGLGLDEIRAAKAVGAKVFVTTHSSSLGWTCQRGTLMRFGEKLCDGVATPAKCGACELQRRGLPKPAAAAVAQLPLTLSRTLGALPGPVGTMLGMPALIDANLERQRTMLEVVDRFFVLTEYARNALVANGFPPEKIAVNRLGVSHRHLAQKLGPMEAPTPNPATVGYLGRFDPIKGVLDLAAAFAKLPRSAALRLAFCGPINTRDDRAVVARIAALTSNDPRVRVRPGVPPSEVPALLRSWDVACFPPICLEGGPTAAIEAHAVGTPVVGTRIGGLAEIVEDGVNGRLTPPGDVAALTETLAALADDPHGTIDAWRLRLPRARTMDEIADDYAKHYGLTNRPICAGGRRS